MLESVCAYIRLEVERYFISISCKGNFVWFIIAYQLVAPGRICVYMFVLFQVKQKQLETCAVILLTRVVAGTSHMAVSYGVSGVKQ